MLGRRFRVVRTDGGVGVWWRGQGGRGFVNTLIGA